MKNAKIRRDFQEQIDIQNKELRKAEKLMAQIKIHQIKRENLEQLLLIEKRQHGLLNDGRDKIQIDADNTNADIKEMETRIRNIKREVRKLENFDGLENGELLTLPEDEIVKIRLDMIYQELENGLDE